MTHRLTQIASVAALAVAVSAVGQARAADPTTADCLTASLASLKLGNEHKVRQERAQLLVCAAESCPADIRKECARRVDEVNAAIPTIIFGAKDASGNDLSAVKVTMDGEVVADRLEGTALSLDPGPHTFVFEAAGQPTIERKFVIQQGQKDRREPVVFGTLAPDPPPPQPTPEPPTRVTEPAKPEPTQSSGDTAKRIVGFTLIGAGVVGAGIAVAEQVTAVGRARDSDNAAASSNSAVQATAKPIHDQAAQAQTYAIISGVAGAAAIGVGIVLVVTAHADAPAPKAAAWRLVPSVDPRGGSLFVEGTF
jgi:hypothetical protein